MILKDRVIMAHDLRSKAHYGAHRSAMPAIDFPKSLKPSIQLDASTSMAADIVIMMDTADEAEAAASVFTPGMPHNQWHKYITNYSQFEKRLTGKSPARFSRCLGSYEHVKIGEVTAMLYKTELHMHEDDHSLPLKDAIKQLIGEVKPKFFLTTGTSGGVSKRQRLGDVMVSSHVRFHTKRDFIALNGKAFESNKWLPTRELPLAERLMAAFTSNIHGDARPECCLGKPHDGPLDITYTSAPVLTTDYFEFGTTKNNLDKIGCCVEMDDAVVAMAISELPETSQPRWACVRNVSDPVINGELDDKEQDTCAEYYYKNFGFWTSVNSALASWAIAAGMSPINR